MKKRIVVLFLKYALGLGLLVWVIWSHWSIPTLGGDDVGIEAALQKPIDIVPLMLASLICFASIVLTFIRWRVLVRTQELPFTLTNALRLGFIGYFLNTVLPGGVGGDIVKAGYLARDQRRRAVAVLTVAIDRAVGLCGLFWLVALLGGVFWAAGIIQQLASTEKAQVILEAAMWSGVGALISSLIFWFVVGMVSSDGLERVTNQLVRFPRIGYSITEVLRAILLYRSQRVCIILAVGMSMVSHAGFLLAFYLGARAIFAAEDIPPFATHFLLVPVGALVRTGFPTPGGVGGTEFAFGSLYELMGFSFEAGVLASLVSRVISWALGLVGFSVYLQMPSTKSNP